MKAAIVFKYGDLNEVSVQEVLVPQIGPEELLVQITAASVNPLDVKLISGNMQGHFPLELPFVVGTDLSGIVPEAAESSTWKKGDRVYGRLEPFPAAGFRMAGRAPWRSMWPCRLPRSPGFPKRWIWPPVPRCPRRQARHGRL